MLFRVLAPADRPLARLAAWFRLAYAFTHGAGVISLGAQVQGPDFDNPPDIYGALIAHLDAFTMSLILFAVHLAIMGWIIWRSRLLPRFIGALLGLAAFAYALDGFALILLPDYEAFYARTQTWIAAAAVIGEVPFLLWLLIKGVPDRPS